MEKIKITQGQADAIEKAWKMSGNKVFIIRMHDRDGSVLIDGRDQLGDISTDTLIKALYIGYEVEPEFKVGEFVLVEKTGNFGCIRTISDNLTNLDYGDGTGSWWSITDIRHATPSEIAEEKERRWWEKYGREVGKFKRKDLLKFKSNNYVIEFWGYDQGAVEYFIGGTLCRGNQLGFLNEVEVLCFAESRLDVSKEGE